MNLLRTLTTPAEERDSFPLPFQQWVDMFSYGGTTMPLGAIRQTLVGNREEISNDYSSLVAGAYQSNGIVFACMLTRMLHFTEARFQFRQMSGGRPGNLFGTPELGILENPWPNGTTGDLLGRMIQDVDLAGNSYTLRLGDTLFRLRPDWTSILLGSRTRRPNWEPGDDDTEVIAYHYKPGGPGSGRDAVLYPVEQVAHFAPIQDPQAYYRGMSWLSPLIREVMADQAMTSHKLKFLEQGATVNLLVKVPAETTEKFNDWVRKIREGHEGVQNAYRTMFLGAGADAVPIGTDMQQMDFKVVQGAGEVRIATVARVPPPLLGIGDGLQGAALNAGNHASIRRMFADGCIRPLWRQAAGALATITRVPSGSILWYDDRDIAFLKEDMKDFATVQQLQASTVSTLIMAGYKPDAVVEAVTSGDFTGLVGSHTGLPSVQLQPGGSANGGSNGTQNGKAQLVPAQSS